jgi:sec-independent protein translocase protein TatA
MEMVVILLIAVLLFGANKIPKLARSTGQAMGEFQKGRQQVEEELEQMEEATSLDSEPDLGLDEEESADLDAETADTSESTESSTSTDSEQTSN